MAYYDRIAKKWHAATGFHGGAFKRYVLNERVLRRIDSLAGLCILELGAGNGYFMPWLLERFSGQLPARIVLTDASSQLLQLAQDHFRVPTAEYLVLDVRGRFPFPDEAFDLVLAIMVFNEVSTPGLNRALAETRRVLGAGGRLVAAVVHPAFVDSLDRRKELKASNRGFTTMPAGEGLRLPVFRRSTGQYEAMLRRSGFRVESEDVFPNERVLSAKAGLRKAGPVPLALLLDCTKTADTPSPRS